MMRFLSMAAFGALALANAGAGAQSVQALRDAEQTAVTWLATDDLARGWLKPRLQEHEVRVVQRRVNVDGRHAWVEVEAPALGRRCDLWLARGEREAASWETESWGCEAIPATP